MAPPGADPGTRYTRANDREEITMIEQHETPSTDAADVFDRFDRVDMNLVYLAGFIALAKIAVTGYLVFVIR
jgi:hypothetical protein